MIMVTGAAGFIGYHTARRLLERGDSVLGVDNLNDYYDPELKSDRLRSLNDYQSFIFSKTDICDQAAITSLFQNHQITKVCHLAAQPGVRNSFREPHVYEKVNMGGFLNVIEASKNSGAVNFVYASSSSVYGDFPQASFKETDDVDSPVSLYAATKRGNELMAYTYSRIFGLPTTGLRFFTVYGPWCRPDMAIPRFTRAILEGREIEVFNYGKMERDFTYIDDIVAGITSALDQNFDYEIFNLGNSHPVDLELLMGRLEDLIGKQAIKKYLPRQVGDPLRTCADIEHAASKLGYKPAVMLETGLTAFVEWFRDYYDI
ncbi:MAG: NAD-dependent epimerase/dehydratase family protein [Syntrophomonadaceae bacterium]|nr:NAD-dependent epimerase/dehydratase family protein [Syntrophomonadaceae bacterium]